MVMEYANTVVLWSTEVRAVRILTGDDDEYL